MHQQKSILLLLSMILIMSTIISASNFQLVKKIGDDRDNYLILAATDGYITEKNEIIILDMKANHVSIYDWEGNFLKKIGQVGQGPGDFYYPTALDYYNGKIYVNDKGNKRIVEIDSVTYDMKFYKQIPGLDFGSEFLVTPSSNFVGHLSHASLSHGRFAIVDKKWNVKKYFFKKFPIEMKPVDLHLDKGESAERVARSIFIDTYSVPIFACDKSRKEMLVSFSFPDNPMVFSVFDFNGKLIKTFSHTLKEKKYRFPEFYINSNMEQLRNPNKYPDLFIPSVRDVAIYKNKYLVFLELLDFKKDKQIKRRRYCLIFDKHGNLIEEFENDKSVYRCCWNYFFGAMVEDEDIKVCVYKLQKKNKPNKVL